MSNQDNEQELMKQFFDEEYSKLQAVDEERARLKDRSNTDGPAPRPSDEYIDQSLGPQLSHVEMASIAQDKAETRMNTLKAKERLTSEKSGKIGKAKIYRKKDAEFKAKLDAFREREAKENQPRSDEEKAHSREAFNRAAHEQDKERGQGRDR